MKVKFLQIKRVMSAALLVLLLNLAGTTNAKAQNNVPTGAINGLFSVSENSQVYFSQGNLQYQASTHTWRFAENQWDYVGNNELGTVYENDVKCDNSLISLFYDGWIDLFGWGTSGNNHGAVCYQPWSTSGDEGAYNVYNNWQANLYDQTGQADWGCNAISNGGNQPNQWRTLTFKEWVYLLFTRTTPSGIRYVKANVNDVNGMLLLPDEWSESYYTLSNINNYYANYNNNIISLLDWTNIFQSHGAVFLPASGHRYEITVYDQEIGGRYWAASNNYYDGLAYYLDFNSDGNYIEENYKSNGFSVRLAIPAQANTSFSIEAVPNPTEGGTISGAGTYDYYAQVTLTANANEGYTFYQWRENGDVISYENSISFVALFDRSLEACFHENNTYPLVYSYNDDNHTATVTGRWEGVELTGELVIPETVMHNGETYTVTAIGEYAFYDCWGLTSVVLPNTLTSIYHGAFEYCGSLTSLNLGTSVTSIGSYAFHACTSLTSLDIPSTVTSIGEWAFYECGELTSVVFPNSLTSLGNWAFRACFGLTEIVIPSSLASIGVNPFAECSSLAQITVESGNAYYDSRDDSHAIIETSTNTIVSASLSTVIPNTVTSIGWDSFNGVLVSSITIPASVNFIGTWAIAHINTLSSITVLAEVPPTLGDCSFCDMDSGIPVYVPCGSLEAYQNAGGWRDFGFVFFEMCPGEIAVAANPTAGGVVSGDGSFEGGSTCTVTAVANEGYVFMNWTENGVVASVNPVYSFTVTGDKNLVANFILQDNIPTGVIEGLFSVSENTQVYFSQGNLQYIGSAASPYWKFADNQWDCLGTTTGQNSDNPNVDRDLFGWGTSGHDHGAVCYQPWSTSNDDKDYQAYDIWYYNLFDQMGQADWGSNAISNGGNQPNQWRTLNGWEWDYVFNTRNTISGIRYAKARVNDVNGVLLLPDNWDASSYILNNPNNGDASFNSNTITASQWSTLEQQGVVFLPAAGYRDGTSIHDLGSLGNYWSASSYYRDWAYLCIVYNWYVGTLEEGHNRRLGRSVRLVHSVPTSPSYSIAVTLNNANGGSVVGAGIYEDYTQVSLTANANDGYVFCHWKENGNIVSEQNPYTFMAFRNRNLEACFVESSSTYPLNYWFNSNDHTATVTGHVNGNYALGELVIPETVTYNGSTYTVTRIEDWAFSDCFGLTGTLVIPNTVTYIGHYAFNACRGFNGSLIIPNSVTFIGEAAFNGCDGFTGDLAIPNSVTSIGYWAFQNCSGFNGSLTIPNSVSTIVEGVFSGCSGFTGDLVIPNSVRSIGSWAFQGCSGFTGDLVIPNSVVSIGGRAFGECSGFSGNLFIPNSISIIEDETFIGCSGFTGDLVIPNSVTTIKPWAFRGCTGFDGNLIIGNSVTQIGEVVFYDCGQGLQSIIVQGVNPATIFDNTFWSISKSIPVYVPCVSLEAYQSAAYWNEFTNIQEGWFDITVSANIAEGGILTGASSYCLGSTCTVNASVNIGYYFVNWTENGEIVSTEPTYSFTVSNNSTLVANFEERYWTASESYPNNMFMIGVVQIDGVEQASPALELGAFCNGECRGTEFPEFEEGRGVYYMNIVGNNGDEISFRLYDHSQQQELNLYCFSVLPFESYGLIGMDAPYEVLFTSTVAVSSSVNPEDAGTVTGTGEYELGAEATVTATANAGYQFNSWAIDGEIVSTEASYTFTVTAPVSLTANFDVLYSVSADVNLEGAGTVTGEGEYLYGTDVTLTATANAGYAFNNWTLEGEVVSTEPTYTFTVTGSVVVTASFNVVQTQQLVQGYNWFSTFVEITLDDLKAALVAALPGTTISINSQSDGSTTYNGARWRGSLNSLDLSQMYMINVTADCVVTVEGLPIDPSVHVATIHPNFNWMAFPLRQGMTLTNAFAGFVVNGDMVISQSNGSSTYFNHWRGSLNGLEPGKGYMYKSNVQGDRTFTFPISTK